MNMRFPADPGSMPLKVLAVSCARSDAGLMAPVWRELRASPRIRLEIAVTGMHLSERFGRTRDWIEAAGFPVDHEVPSLVDDEGTDDRATARAMGRGIQGFADLLDRARPDLLLLLGDRFDMLPAAVAALPFRIPVAHVSGGELSFGAIDEQIRHAISKLAHLHFPCTAGAAERLRCMGEESWRIHVVGAPGLDAVRGFLPASRAALAERYGFDPEGRNILLAYHPVTLEVDRTPLQVGNILAALEGFDATVIASWPNADPGSDAIIAALEAFGRRQPARFRPVKNAGHEGWLSLLAHADLLVGNSSSGLAEAAAFELPVVDVGIRQQGRLKPANVISCGNEIESVRRAIESGLEPGFRAAIRGLVNPYGDGHTAEGIREVIENLPPLDRLIVKRFEERPAGEDAFPKLELEKKPVEPIGP